MKPDWCFCESSSLFILLLFGVLFFQAFLFRSSLEFNSEQTFKNIYILEVEIQSYVWEKSAVKSTFRALKN